jgi:hypothetical protein
MNDNKLFVGLLVGAVALVGALMVKSFVLDERVSTVASPVEAPATDTADAVSVDTVVGTDTDSGAVDGVIPAVETVTPVVDTGTSTESSAQ